MSSPSRASGALASASNRYRLACDLSRAPDKAHYPEPIVIRRGIPCPHDFPRRSFFDRRVTIAFAARLSGRGNLDRLGACPRCLESKRSHVVDDRAVLELGTALRWVLREGGARPARPLDAGGRREVPRRRMRSAQVPPAAPVAANRSDRDHRSARTVVRTRRARSCGTSMATATRTSATRIEGRSRVRRVSHQAPRHRHEHDLVGRRRRDQVPLVRPPP